MERRRFIVTTGFTTAAATGMAGCMGGGGDGEGNQSDGGDTGDDGDGGDGQDLSGPLPEEYRTAESLSGTPRNPDSLQSKEQAQYQSQPEGDQQCDNCTQYVPVDGEDGLGGCALVEGWVEDAGWCALYSRYEEA